jgi:uncharacterized membrane protein required for colicin V production
MITDIVILLIIVVLAYIGWRRGLVMTVISFAMTLISLAVVWFLMGPATRLLENAPFLKPISDNITEKIVDPMQSAGNSIADAVGSLGLPAVAEELLIDKVSQNGDSVAVWQELSGTLFRMVLSAGLFLLLFSVVMILVIVIGNRLTGMLDHLPLLGLANRLAGLLVSLLLCLVVIHAIIYDAALISPVFPAVTDWIKGSAVLSWFYESEMWQGLLDTIFS